MRLITGALTGLGLMMASMLPTQVAAEAKIYPYHAANYCPAGLQPITISGVICCGQPNQHMSYNQMMAHPVAKKKVHKVRRVVRSARPTCLPGTKGCSNY
ncbi:hypothetical protein Z945_2650 [Sulfitobacter noctilucae]|uniref:hypothetical protein n=1 Tax=Sulfitobacter noctilucae TaxID=1342302 RepID=UPI00056234AD|nr:hypothetical protein [Sulfitobacter noctilucae]KIN61657.1 hypothetical protein Z945_2650 [Sulfitobacter noctilucae]